MATAVFVFRQLICFLFLTAWLAMFCYDNFLDKGEVLVPFWFNAIGVGVLAFSLGVNVENITAFRGIQIMPSGPVIPPTTEYAPPAQPQTRPYVPPNARQ